MNPIETGIVVETPWGSFTTKDRIISVGSISTYTSNLGSTSSVSLVLDDTDGVMKSVYDNQVIYSAVVSLYQSYVGGSTTLIFQGTVGGDVVWDEGARTLSFDVESVITSGKVGHIPETTTTADGKWKPKTWPWPIAAEIESLDKQAFNKMWPLCFGTVVNSPALRITKPVRGTTKEVLTEDSTTITIEHGDRFPQDPTELILRVGNIYYEGTFTGDVFTPTTPNMAITLLTPVFESVFALRPPKDPDFKSTSVAWVVDMYDFSGMWLTISGTGITGSQIVKVGKQLGRKIWFDVLPTVLIMEDHVIETLSGGLKTGDLEGDYAIIYEDEAKESKYIAEDWTIVKGAPVVDEGNRTQWYVVNSLASSTIHSVKAYRTLKGIRTLETIPDAYYTYYPTQTLDGKQVSAIAFPVALPWIPDEEWEDDVYVTLTSPQGPNVADVISYILSTYTSLTPDSTFTSVATDTEDYPIGFTLFNQQDALKLVADIAWQARCALLRVGSAVGIKYLSKYVGGIAGITNAKILERSMRFGLTKMEDLRTVLKANWNEDYTDGGSRTLVYSNNTDLYGKVEEEYTFFIYNQAALVKKSLDFWGYRQSNIWRTVGFDAPMDGTNYYHNTVYNATLPYWGTAYLTLLTTSQSAGVTQSLAFVMATKMGSTALDLNYWKGDPANEIESSDPDLAKDLTVGHYQFDYYPLIGVPEPRKIYTVSTYNNSGRELKQYDIMLMVKKDDADANVAGDLGTAIKCVDVDHAHRMPNELCIVESVTADGDPMTTSRANKPNSRVRWNGTVVPKVGQVWGPLMWDETDTNKRASNYVPGTIDPRGNAFVIVGSIDEDKKNCLVAPNTQECTEEVVFMQSNGDLVAAGESWPEYSIVGCDKRLVSVFIAATDAGSGYTFDISLNGSVDSQVALCTLATPRIILTGEGLLISKFQKVAIVSQTTGSTAKGVEIRLKFVNYGSSYSNIGNIYEVIV